MKKINITYGNQIVLASDFNLLVDSNLEYKGGKPILKEKSVARMVELKARLFKSFEFGNGSRISDEKLVIPEFKYLQNKKW